MKKKAIKYALIIISIILFVWVLIEAVISTLSYSTNVFDFFSGLPIEIILSFDIKLILATVLLVVGLIIKTDKKDNEDSTPSKEKRGHRNNIGWMIAFGIGIVPFVICFVAGIDGAINGYSFFYNTSYGFEGLCDAVLMLSYVFWPTYIIGAALIVLSIVKIHQNQNRQEE